MSGPRIFAGIVGVVLLLALVMTIARTDTIEDLWFELLALFDQPWGVAMIANLYAGFALMAVIIAIVEGSLMAGLLWAAPMLVLGNLWAALWLVMRLPRLIERLRPPAA